MATNKSAPKTRQVRTRSGSSSRTAPQSRRVSAVKGDAPGHASALPSDATGALIPVEQIDSSPYQARRTFDDARLQELANSISEIGGLLNPITVRASGNGRFELLAGERRLRAVKLLGLCHVPAVVLKADDRRAPVASLVENLQREDLNAMDRATGLTALKEALGPKTSWAQVSKRVGLSKSRVSQLVALTDFPEPVKQLVAESKLSEGQARAVRKAAKDVTELERVAVAVAETQLPAQHVAPIVGVLRQTNGVHKLNNPGDSRLTDMPAEPATRPAARVRSQPGDLLRIELFKVRSAVEKILDRQPDDQQRKLISDALVEHVAWANATIAKLPPATSAAQPAEGEGATDSE